jgi:hypothetical protein
LSVGYIPVNLASFFFGVKRGAEALTQLTIGPIAKSLPPKILQSIQNDDFQKLMVNLDSYKTRVSRFYASTIIISLIVMLYGQIKWNLLGDDRFFYCLTCVTLLCYSWLSSVEIPYSMIASGYGRSKIFYKSNFIFCACLCIATAIVVWFQYYSILPLGLLISQVVVYLINMSYVRDVVSKND